MGNTLLCTKVWWSSQRKLAVRIVLWAELPTFFREHHFYLEEQLRDKPWLLRLGYVADSFLKMSKVSLSLQENNWQYLLLMIKRMLSSENQNFGRLVSTTMNMTAFRHLNILLMRLRVTLTTLIVLNITYTELCHYLKDVYNSVNQYFPNDTCYYKIMPGRKRPFKDILMDFT